MFRSVLLQLGRCRGGFLRAKPLALSASPRFLASTPRFLNREDTEGHPAHVHEDEDFEDVDSESEVFLSAGKSHYRRRENLPEWTKEKQKEICQHRTKAQIRRCLKKWMIQQGRDFEKKRKYRLRSLDWKETPKKIGATRVSDGTLDVHAYGPEETIAYMGKLVTIRSI